MIGHQQAEATMPDKLVVIVHKRSKDTAADFTAAELIFSRRHTFDSDEKPASFGHPLRDGMRQLLARRFWDEVISRHGRGGQGTARPTRDVCSAQRAALP